MVVAIDLFERLYDKYYAYSIRYDSDRVIYIVLE